MPPTIIKDILDIQDLNTEPQHFNKLFLSEEITQNLSWLLGYDGKGRRLIKCDQNGALLFAPIYCGYPISKIIGISTVQNTWTNVPSIPEHKIMTIFAPLKAAHIRVYETIGGDYNDIVLCPQVLHYVTIESKAITINTFPNTTGTVDYLGFCFYNE